MQIPRIRHFCLAPAIACMLLLLAGCGQGSGEAVSGNTLGEEASPYLKQHAANPVHWKAWDEALLAQAEAEDKLLIVSIGYASCHWCHVMEEETFENDSVARLMNENFINIKVDREERPDIDQVYLTAVQLMTGNGGWPLNVVILPNGKPVYGGTYHTTREWTDALNKVLELYKTEPGRLREYAEKVGSGIRQINLIQPETGEVPLPGPAGIAAAVGRWKQQWDTQAGGDTGAQKFLVPGNLSFLLDFAELTGDSETRAHVERTLDRMVNGGVYDHLGGGFFRYSTDPDWRVPHFEKMLYDNAQMLGLLAKAYKVFQKPLYKRRALETIRFLQRRLKGPEGGYYSAIDADSEGEEGKYYLWQASELKRLLGDQYDRFAAHYNTQAHAVGETNRVVLYRLEDGGQNADPEALEAWRNSLLEERGQRVAPQTDTKIITSWNALLIRGYVEAYEAFGEEVHLQEARNLFEVILEVNSAPEGFRHTGGREEGFLEDYAYMARAALSLYTGTLEVQYLDRARDIFEQARIKFPDADSPLFRYNKEDATLFSKIIKVDDGVLPSPNAVMADIAFLLGHIDYSTEYSGLSREMLRVIQPSWQQNPNFYARWGSLFLNAGYPFYEIAVVGEKAGALTTELHRLHLPNTLVVGSREESELPLFDARYVAGETYLYVCRDNACKLPVQSVPAALVQLREFQGNSLDVFP